MRFLWDFLKYLVLLVLLLLFGAGCYAGDLAYQELFSEPWDKVLGIENHRNDLASIHQLEAQNGWQKIQVTSTDGTKLTGTYIPMGSKKTVMILHGLYQNRTMSVPYARIYQKLGYNILMPDIRGHGESGGRTDDWGIHDIEDMNSWVRYLHTKTPDGTIGFHGISLGAAMSLLYAGSASGKNMAFCVADSSYGNILELGQEKLLHFTGDQRLLLGMEMTEPFFRGALYCHTGKTLGDLDPLEQVRHMKIPVLFLHGDVDQLVPPHIAENLLNACASQQKKLVYFQGSGHATAIGDNPEGYVSAIEDFLQSSKL